MESITQKENSIKEEAMNNEEARKQQLEEALKQAKELADPAARMRRLKTGRLALEKPIRARSTDIDELEFDFGGLSCMEIADAMDADTSANSTFRITWKQALQLFASAAAKKSDKADSADILRGLGTADAIKAVQVTTAFFIACSQAGNMRYTAG